MAKPGEPPPLTAAKTVAVGPEKPVDAASASGTPAVTLPTDALIPAPVAAPMLTRGTAVGRYVLEEPLGEGGMGVVYTAHDPELGRRVALKLLRLEVAKGGDGSGGRGRLVREAHAMAKLNHPNVVGIYDSGVYGDQVFLAVELVAGTTLKAWLREAPRSWREILDVFQQAGCGLAAAHAAGLVHRDFKPENVLIGRGGEVKVADFGLARAAASDPAEPAAELTTDTATDLASDPVLATPLTRTGLVTGTPAYMAPEQFLARGGDARTDEFSFCVALYRSLYGELPFEGRPDPLATNRIKPPPRGTRVPVWVRRALLRGLSIRPEDRYPTLNELLATLADDPAVRQKRLLTAAGVAALVVGAIAATATIVVRGRAGPDPCHDPEGQLVGVWDDTIRSRVQAAFAASGATDAVSTGAYAERAMDRVSGAWLAAYRDACSATRTRHAQPEAALHLRLDCLDDQRFGLRAAGEIMSHPDSKSLSSAVGAASTLPLPVECADARALSIVEQTSPERRQQVEALRLRLARGQALGGAARYSDALGLLEGLPDEAKRLEAPSLEANALDALAVAYGELYDYEKAIEFYTQAEEVATSAHMDPLATEAAASIVVYKAMLGSPRVEVVSWLDRARADLRRVGPGTKAEFYVERAIGFGGGNGGHDLDSVRHTRKVLDLAERVFGSDRSETMHAANELASNLALTGQYDESIALLRRAIAGADAILGPNNQRVLTPQFNLASYLLHLGRTDEAEQALDSLFARLGSEERIQTAVGLAAKAALQSERKQWADSLGTAHRAIEMAGRLHMLTNDNWDEVHQYAIEAYLGDNQPSRALDEYEKYFAHRDLPADSADWVDYLRLGGWSYLDAGQPEKALPVLERALRLSAAHPLYPGWVPRLRYQIAQALVQTGGDLARAEELALAAHDELLNVPVAKDLLAEVDAWRAKTFKPL